MAPPSQRSSQILNASDCQASMTAWCVRPWPGLKRRPSRSGLQHKPAHTKDALQAQPPRRTSTRATHSRGTRSLMCPSRTGASRATQVPAGSSVGLSVGLVAAHASHRRGVSGALISVAPQVGSRDAESRTTSGVSGRSFIRKKQRFFSYPKRFEIDPPTSHWGWPPRPKCGIEPSRTRATT